MQTKTPIVFLIDLTVDACRIILTVQRTAAYNQRIKGRQPCIYPRKKSFVVSIELKGKFSSEHETMKTLFGQNNFKHQVNLSTMFKPEMKYKWST